MTTQNPNPNDPSDPQGGNGGFPNYDTGAAFAMTPEPGDGLIRDKKNYLEITALVFGVLAIISMIMEAYSAAGKTWFGWWLVEHYLPYHVNCPDGCVSGEPTRGRKDPPYFQMGYGSLDHIPDLVDPLVESPLPA